MLVRFGLAIAVFCGLMLLAGVLSGKLETWLFALYFVEKLHARFASLASYAKPPPRRGRVVLSWQERSFSERSGTPFWLGVFGTFRNSHRPS